ncbi:MAG: DUF3300 domain-containing protein [Pseudomonadota bacterium]
MSRTKSFNYQPVLALFAAAALALLPVSGAMAQQTTQEAPLLSAPELEDLVARVALYPDELLGIVLPASTYPLQIVEASRFLDARDRDDTLEPDPEWDDAVVALLNYPEALELMNDDLDWTWQLGEAVLAQQGDILEAVEAFRDNAFLAGNLVSDERQQVARDDTGIRISTTEPDVVYVPYYDPVQVVVRHDYPALYYHDYGYPLYYYPYAASHRFNRGFFFGVSTAFAISWRHRYLHLHYYDHFGHPFYGRQFVSRNYFRFRSNRDYRLFAGNRRFNHRGNLFRWYPGRSFGNRPRVNRYSANNNRRTLRYANQGNVNRTQQRANRRARNERRNYRTFDNVVDRRANRANGERIARRQGERNAADNNRRRTAQQSQRATANRADRNRVADSRARRSQDGAVTRQNNSQRARYTTDRSATNQTRQRNTNRAANNRQPSKERYQRADRQPVKQYATPQRSQANAQPARSTRQTQQRVQRERPARQTQQRAQRQSSARQSQSRQRSSSSNRSTSQRSNRSSSRSSGSSNRGSRQGQRSRSR